MKPQPNQHKSKAHSPCSDESSENNNFNRVSEFTTESCSSSEVEVPTSRTRANAVRLPQLGASKKIPLVTRFRACRGRGLFGTKHNTIARETPCTNQRGVSHLFPSQLRVGSKASRATDLTTHTHTHTHTHHRQTDRHTHTHTHTHTHKHTHHFQVNQSTVHKDKKVHVFFFFAKFGS